MEPKRTKAMTPSQVRALNLIKRVLGHNTIPDGDRFQVRSIADIGGGEWMVHGHVGKGSEARWFEDHYSLIIGARGAVTMVDGGKSMEQFNGKTWCSIHVKLTSMKKGF